MNERIKAIRKHFNLNQADFGKRIGVSRDTIANIEGNRIEIKDLFIKSICGEFGVDYIWLTTGEGEMFVCSDDDVLEIIDRIMAGENEFHKKLIKWCATALDDEDLRRLESRITDFIAEFAKKD